MFQALLENAPQPRTYSLAVADSHYLLIQVCRKLGRTDDAERESRVSEALRAKHRHL